MTKLASGCAHDMDGVRGVPSRSLPHVTVRSSPTSTPRDEGAMSAECPKCGWDLPFMGDCEMCALDREIVVLKREREADRAAIRALRKATDKLSHCSHACSAPCPHTRKYIESMMFDLDVAAAIQRAQDDRAGEGTSC